MPVERRQLYNLLKLNLALQAFDAIATYQGLKLGWQEANPILVIAFAYLGVAPALLLFKAKACGLLYLLHRYAENSLVIPSLQMLAAVYTVMSLGPWMVMYLGLLTQVL